MNPLWPLDAACKDSDATWHWSDHTPRERTVSALMDICAQCRVVADCRQDMADTGEGYSLQVRGGLRMWRDADQLPPARVGYTYTAPRRREGRPRGPLSILHIKPSKNSNWGRQHTRGPWNTNLEHLEDTE